MATFKIEGIIFGRPDKKRTCKIDADTVEDAKFLFERKIIEETGKLPFINYVTECAPKDTTKTSDKLSALPEPIRNTVKSLLKGHRINKFSFELTSSIRLEEDATYHSWTIESGWNSIKMGGEWGGYKTGVAGAINAPIALPVGAFVIEDQIFCGKYFVHVYHNNGIAQVR